MKFQGALIKEQGVTFGIVVVRPYVLSTPQEAEKARNLGKKAFGPLPIVLMAQNSRGTPTYQGPKDIVNFLAKIPFYSIPWREYSLI